MGLSEWLLLLSGVLTILYLWMKHHYAYWRNKNVAYVEPNPFFGNFKKVLLMTTSAADHMCTLYNHKNSQNQPVVGIYVLNKPTLLVRDLELIKTVMIKDFNKFSNRFSACDPHEDALGSYNLFFVKNPYWRELRTKLTPVFTSGKMRQMFPLVEEIGNELDKYLCSLPLDPKTNSCIAEVRNISALFTTDVIASVAFGVQANSLRDPNGDFRRNGKSLFEFTPYRSFEFSVIFFLPKLVTLLGCKLFSKASAKFLRNTTNFVMAERMKSGIPRNDLIDILVAFKKAAQTDTDKKHLELSNDMLVAQAAVFFTAGSETASASISFALYELSKKPDIQKRLRKEIKEALIKNDGKVTYEMLHDMEYLNMVTQEALRLYPPLPFLDRECTLTKDEKEFSLQPHSNFSIPHGMPVYIPIYAIQRDPKYFPNPDEFDPERFSKENKANVIPTTYMPFGTGPHSCIGERLGLIQIKTGITNFMKNHYITSCDKSRPNMVLNPRAVFLQPKGGIYCKVVRDPLLV